MVVGLHLPGLQALCLPSFRTKGRAWSWRGQKHQQSNPGVPNLFGSSDQFYGKQFFHQFRGWGMVWGWFKHFIVYFISIIILYLHFRSSGIRSQRLGTPCLMDRGSYLYFWSKVLEQHCTVYNWWAEQGSSPCSQGRGGYYLRSN